MMMMMMMTTMIVQNPVYMCKHSIGSRPPSSYKLCREEWDDFAKYAIDNMPLHDFLCVCMCVRAYCLLFVVM